MNPSHSRMEPESFPNGTRTVRALRACAVHGSGIRVHGSGVIRVAVHRYLTVGASLRPAFPDAECTGYAGGAS